MKPYTQISSSSLINSLINSLIHLILFEKENMEGKRFKAKKLWGQVD